MTRTSRKPGASARATDSLWKLGALEARNVLEKDHLTLEEVESFPTLSADRHEHLAGCSHCADLVESAHSQEGLEKVLDRISSLSPELTSNQQLPLGIDEPFDTATLAALSADHDN